MTDSERDLLHVTVAFHLGLVARDEVKDLVRSGEGGGIGGLVATGRLSRSDLDRVRDVARRRLEANGGDLARTLGSFEPQELAETQPASPAAEEGTLALTRLPQGGLVSDSDGERARYALDRELGRGGLGCVFLAFDRKLMGREVAMKLMRSDGDRDDASGQRRFLEEAQLTAHLQHPNIVPVHDLGVNEAGEPFYTMGVVRGTTLREEIRSAHAAFRAGEIPRDGWGLARLRLLSAFQGLGNAIAYAHDRGVVHRDIKPANVMLGEYGETIVLDWGLAKVLEAKEGPVDPASSPRATAGLRARPELATVEGTVSGTPAYMAPEQAAGRTGDIDARSDIYALGAVLYEILTGRPPVEGSDVRDVLARVVEGRITDPRLLPDVPPVPDDLADACLRAMSAARERRHANVKELLGEIAVSIEGTQERQRNRARCAEKLSQARALVREHRELRDRIDDREALHGKLRAEIPAWEPHDGPSGKKRQLLALELEVEEARWLAGCAFDAALVALAEALSFEPDSAEVRAELAELHYAQMVRAEARGKARELEFHRSQAELYNDGALDLRLRGDGSLCLETSPPGARAVLHRYVEEQWFLRPVDEVDLGQTPFSHRLLPMGSYLLILHKDGYRPTRVPFVVGRLQPVSLSVRLFRDEEIGAGFVHVPAGTFLMGEQATPRWVDDVFMSVFPVSFGEYCEYLDALEAVDPERVPVVAPQDAQNGILVAKGPDGRYMPVNNREAHPDCPPDPRLPAFSVTCENAQLYAEWRSTRDGRPYVLPTEAEWEKAARGVDGRLYPWGNRFDPTLCRTADSLEFTQPALIGAYPTDESPYGVRDMAGGVSDWTADPFDTAGLLWKVKGGGWGHRMNACRLSFCHRGGRSVAHPAIGFRLAVRPEPARR